MKAIGAEGGYCNACYTGKYPFKITKEVSKLSLESGLD